MALAIVICLFLIVGSAILISRNSSSLIQKFFWPALILKLIAGLTIGWLYTYYYTTGDTFGFFIDATKLSQHACHDFFDFLNFILIGNEEHPIVSEFLNTQERSIFFIKIVACFNLLSSDNYWITSLYFSFLSFLAAWYLVSVLVRHFPERVPAIVIAFLFLPTCVLWSSGIIKESMAIVGIFFIVSIFLEGWFQKRIKFWQWAMLLLAMYMVWNLKYYYLGVLIPTLIVIGFVQVISAKVGLRFWQELMLLVGGLLLMFFAVSFIHPNFNTHRFLDVVVLNHDAFIEASSVEDVIHYYALAPKWSSIILNAPLALFSGLFRPFVWEATTFFQLLVSFENLIILLLVIASFRKLKEVHTSPHRLLVIGVLIYIVVLCIFLSLSTPNFGTLVRYRIGFLPFLVALIADLSITQKLFSKLG